MQVGDKVIYRPKNWVNGVLKVNDPLFGKQVEIIKVYQHECMYLLKIEDGLQICYPHEVERK